MERNTRKMQVNTGKLGGTVQNTRKYEKNEEKYEKKRATNTDTALNGFVREKYLDKCFPRGALSSREEKETMLEQIQIQI